MKQNLALQRTDPKLLRAALAAVCLALVASLAVAAPLGTAFTYQGVLKDDMGNPQTGIFDFEFRVYDDADPMVGTLLGSLTLGMVTVTDGLFVVELDFGTGIFDGTDLWLEIVVDLEVLDPLQHLTAAPYALFGQDSDTLDGMDSSEFATPAEIEADITAHAGVLDAHHTPTVDTDTVLTEAQVETFVTNDPLDGSNLTNLNASNLSTGTVAEARIADEMARDAEVLALVQSLIAAERDCPGAVPGRRYTDCDNGKIRDNNTGLYWLKDASCADLPGTDPSGQGNWATAEAAAAALADGTCGLTDGSVAGDWRQPTISEICSAWSGSSLAPCPASAAPDSLVNSNFTNPRISNAKGDAPWTEGDAFSGVQSSFYWSSSSVAGLPTGAWLVRLDNGDVFGNNKTGTVLVWPVRGEP